MDSRKNRSSSTTETNDAFGIWPPALRSELRRGSPKSRSSEREPCCLRERVLLEQCECPVNFSLCRVLNSINCAPRFCQTNAPMLWFCACVSHLGAVLDCTLGLTCKASSHADLCDRNKSSFPRLSLPENQHCLTQNRPSWSSTTIRTFGPRLGVSCDRSDWRPNSSRPSPIFSSRIRRMAPPAWSST